MTSEVYEFRLPATSEEELKEFVAEYTKLGWIKVGEPEWIVVQALRLIRHDAPENLQ